MLSRRMYLEARKAQVAPILLEKLTIKSPRPSPNTAPPARVNMVAPGRLKAVAKM